MTPGLFSSRAVTLKACGLVLGWLMIVGCAGDSQKTVPPQRTSSVRSESDRFFEKLKHEEGERAISRESEATFRAITEARLVEGQVLVKYKQKSFEGEGLPQTLKVLSQVSKRVCQEFQAEVLSRYLLLGIELLKVSREEPLSALIAKLQQDPDIDLAEPNYKVYAFQESVVPNDSRWDELWAMRKIKMTEAWNRSTGSAGVRIAVIDTGIDYTHPDLAENIWKNPGESFNGVDDDGNGIVDDVNGADFCSGANSGNPMDDNGHGTHVAGTIAAIGNNHRDVVGVNWKTQLMAVKFLCQDGSGTTADAIQAIQYALSMGADILNNSWGGAGHSRALEAAIKESDRLGALFVAAAGNEQNDNDQSPSYPASYAVPNVIAVAATTQDDALAGFSNWGQTSVHLAAPGVSILSTIPGNRLASFNGTSMAAPHAAGCAGLIKARNSSLQGRALKAVLTETADKVHGLQGRISEGRRLNCGNAVQ